MVERIGGKRLRPAVQRLLNLTPIERSMGLPQLIGHPEWIVHARLHRGILIDLLQFADGHADVYGRTMEVLHSRFVETWTFGSGYADFKKANPGAVAESEANLETLIFWVDRLEPYTIRAIAEYEAACGLPFLQGAPDLAVYARCRLIRYLRNRSKHFEAVDRPDFCRQSVAAWRIALFKLYR